MKKTIQAFVLLSISHFCVSQTPSLEDLLGSYSLKRIDYIYNDTTVTIDPSQAGFLVIAPKRYAIAYNPGLAPRTAFKDLSNPSKEEVSAGFKSFAFNSGFFTYEEGVFGATPDFAKVPGFEGGEQIYKVEQLGEVTSFTMYDETYPSGKKPAWYGKLKIQLFFEKE